jgi:uncharacterized protein YifN (PemK superfamily)
MSEQQIESALAKAAHTLKTWFAVSGDAKEKFYAVSHATWTAEKMEKNKWIRERKADKVQRRRKRVYWTDLGMNVGSELSESHFCVVIREFQTTSVVIPLSSVKETDAEKGFKTEENGYYKIGVIENLPDTKKEAYAVISQIRTVSKKRLSDYKAPGTSQYIQLSLTERQMDIIDKAVQQLFVKS